jgi:hypothetical protein
MNNEYIIFVIKIENGFYSANRDDWFLSLNSECIYFSDIQAKMALELAKKNYRNPSIATYKITPI